MAVRRSDLTSPGAAVLVALALVPVALWAAALPLGPRFTGAAATLTSLGVICALVGVSAFALNLVLGARLRFVERLFDGLEQMYLVHRGNGRVAFVLLVAHFVLIVAGRAAQSVDSALALFNPGFGWTTIIGLVALTGMAVAIVLTLFVRLGHEVFVYVQRAFGFVFMIGALHVFLTPGTKAASRALTWYLVAITLAGIGAFAYRSLLGNLLVRRRHHRVVEVNRLDDHVTEIVMAPLGEPLEFTPGQFVFVNFRSKTFEERFHPVSVEPQGQSAVVTLRPGEIANQFHPFSITSAPGERELKIAVKAVGDYTGAMRGLEPGAVAIVEGPYGSFSHRNVRNTKQVWLSGGIGLTPFLSMARSLGSDPVAVDLYYCVERDSETYFLDEFLRIDESEDGLRVIPLIRERDGFVTAERIEELSGGLDDKDFLICGPPAMIAALRSQLAAKGVPPDRIHAEEFGFARLGDRRG